MAPPRPIVEFAPGAGPLDLPATVGDENYLALEGAGWLETTDAAVLDLTTTFDIRVELAPTDFAPATDEVLIGKWQPSQPGETSWLLLLTTTGQLRLIWHDVATGQALERRSTQPLPIASPRLAVRVSGDFSGGTDAVTFFTGGAVQGPWALLGEAVDGGSGPAQAGNAPVLLGAFDPDFQPASDDDGDGDGDTGEPEPGVLFFDDFTGPELYPGNRGLNPANWFVHNRPNGDESYVNNEWQLYVPGQVSVENSLLTITCDHLGGQGPGSYLSGLVTTAAKMHFGPPAVTGGLRVEIRLRAPGSDGATQGLWPSLYTLEQGSSEYFGGNIPQYPGGAQGVPGWPTTGKSEVDIWEWPGFSAFQYHTNRHWSDTPGGSDPVGGRTVDTSPIDITASFNVYAFVWTTDYMSWEFNGVEKHRITPDVSPPPSQPMFAIINFAIGGDFGGQVGENTKFPAFYEIDWLKITQLLPSTKVEQLVDAFTPPDPIWSASGEAGEVTVTGGGVEITLGPAYPTYRTTSRGWDLLGSSVYAQVGQVPNVGGGTTQAFLTLTFNHVEGAAPAGEVRIGYNGGNLVGEHQVDQNYVEVFALAHSPATHRFWRLAEAGGTITYSTSPDGATWTARGQVATTTIGFSAAALDVELVGGHYGTEVDPGVFRVEGVNTVVEVDDPPPPSGEQPDATNTGLTNPGALSAAGTNTITAPGTYLDLDFTGQVEVRASNVTFRNCRFTGPSGGALVFVRTSMGVTGCLLEDCEIDGAGATDVAVGYGQYTLRRMDIHDVIDGPRMSTNTLTEASLIHDLTVVSGSHNDGIQSTGPGSGVTIRGNTIVNTNTQTSAILIGADLGDISDVLVQDNWLDAHCAYTLTIGADPGFTLTNCVITGNRITRDFGVAPLLANTSQDIRFVDNVFDPDGAPIPDQVYP